MTNDEYGRLIEFIGRRFDEVDAKLAEHDARFEQIDTQFGEVLGQIEHLGARAGAQHAEGPRGYAPVTDRGTRTPDCVVPGTFNRAFPQFAIAQGDKGCNPH